VELALPEFDYLRQTVYELSSIIIDPGKEYLAESRLSPVAHEEGFASVQELLARMRQGTSMPLRQRVLDAMTNNETSFFRDVAPFEALREIILPEIIASNSRDGQLSIWSAASSTGQEAYSIAMLLDKYFGGLPGWRVKILATDISTSALQRAREGRYSQMEVSRGLTQEQLKRYFSNEGAEWKIIDSIRSMVEFRSLNLFDSWDAIPPCDILFLRNVLIYFEVEKKKQILAKVRSILKPTGYVLLGSAETTLGLDDGFERIQCGPISYCRLKRS